jgi:hypothetical protein
MALWDSYALLWSLGLVVRRWILFQHLVRDRLGTRLEQGLPAAAIRYTPGLIRISLLAFSRLRKLQKTRFERFLVLTLGSFSARSSAVSPSVLTIFSISLFLCSWSSPQRSRTRARTFVKGGMAMLWCRVPVTSYKRTRPQGRHRPCGRTHVGQVRKQATEDSGTPDCVGLGARYR